MQSWVLHTNNYNLSNLKHFFASSTKNEPNTNGSLQLLEINNINFENINFFKTLICKNTNVSWLAKTLTNNKN